jgi:hypothetical protein
MTFQRRILLQPPLFEAVRPTQVPGIPEECSSFAIHDLAALAEGNLSREGMKRLATHLPQCQTCTATLLAVVEDTQPGRGTGDHSLAAWLAVMATSEDSDDSPPASDSTGDK